MGRCGLQLRTAVALHLLAIAVEIVGDRASNRVSSCCSEYNKEIPKAFFCQIKSYTLTERCLKKDGAVLFVTKSLGLVCADPQKNWVKQLRRFIDRKVKCKRKPKNPSVSRRVDSPTLKISRSTERNHGSSGTTTTTTIHSPNPSSTDLHKMADQSMTLSSTDHTNMTVLYADPSTTDLPNMVINTTDPSTDLPNTAVHAMDLFTNELLNTAIHSTHDSITDPPNIAIHSTHPSTTDSAYPSTADTVNVVFHSTHPPFTDLPNMAKQSIHLPTTDLPNMSIHSTHSSPTDFPNMTKQPIHLPTTDIPNMAIHSTHPSPTDLPNMAIHSTHPSPTDFPNMIKQSIHLPTADLPNMVTHSTYPSITGPPNRNSRNGPAEEEKRKPAALPETVTGRLDLTTAVPHGTEGSGHGWNTSGRGTQYHSHLRGEELGDQEPTSSRIWDKVTLMIVLTIGMVATVLLIYLLCQREGHRKDVSVSPEIIPLV
ncbi:mucin-2-like [Hypanus sabinus]|uniref:mucin-2-like n=1 Tax=Hypanus sabinus TaxID=79690 RepID=UPI0028C45C1B|nr:mucin-2-like [Hypanus sabinus]